MSSPHHVGIIPMPPRPPLAGPEPFFDLEKEPAVELSLLLRPLADFFFVAHPAASLFPLRDPRFV